MKKGFRTTLCLLMLILLVPAVVCLREQLPSNPQPLIEKKYGGWAGVLRLWILEGWQPGAGSVAAWLNRSIASYEKDHPGVYVQPEYVNASALGDLGSDGFTPPDMVLFPPGALPNSNTLLPLEEEYPLRPGLWRSNKAVPIMLGGYMWAYNADFLDGLPSSWQNAEVPPAAFEDEPWRRWSIALLAMCSGRYAAEPSDPKHTVEREIDLGLPEGASMETPVPSHDAGPLRCLLPENFKPSASAWNAFVNGEAAALTVTQREIRRLQSLSNQGQGVDWRLGWSGDVFTDQVIYMGIVNRPDASEKLALCQALLRHLLSAPCQSALHLAGAFSVTSDGSGYLSGDALGEMEALLNSQTPILPDPFDMNWSEDLGPIVRNFFGGDADPAALWGRAATRIRQISEY